MPTENRRVATYLPKEIDDRLKAFIAERSLKGDSPALIVILAEYFGVSQQVAQKVDYSLFVTQEQLNEVVAKVSEIAVAVDSGKPQGGLISKLPEKLRRLEERIESLEATNKKPLAEERVDPIDSSTPGQMDLLAATADSSFSDSESGSPSTPSELREMTDAELARRFGLGNPRSLTNRRVQTRDNPDGFMSWSKKKDPDGIAWLYDFEKKHYYPIVNSSPVSLDGSLIPAISP